MGFFRFFKEYNRLQNKEKENINKQEHSEEKPALKLEKADIPAIMIAALITFGPILLVLIGLFLLLNFL